MFKRLAVLLSATALALGGALVPQASAAAESAADPRICYRAYVESVGWEPDEWCNGIAAGLPGLSIQSLQLSASEVGTLCARAHLSRSGWQARQCSSTEWGQIQIGSTTAGQAITGIELSVTSGTVTASVELSDIGFQEPRTGSTIQVGRPGSVYEIEVIGIAVN
ncbi:hypothetical protein [Streptomyces mayteni]